MSTRNQRPEEKPGPEILPPSQPPEPPRPEELPEWQEPAHEPGREPRPGTPRPPEVEPRPPEIRVVAPRRALSEGAGPARTASRA